MGLYVSRIIAMKTTNAILNPSVTIGITIL